MKRKSIGSKIMLLFIGALLFNILFLMSFIGISGSKFLYSLGDRFLGDILFLAEHPITRGLEEEDYRSIGLLIESLMEQEPSIEQLYVYNEMGSLAAMAVSPDLSGLPSPPEWMDLTSSLQENEDFPMKQPGRLRISRLLHRNGDIAGAVILFYNRNLLTGQVNRVRTLFLIHSLTMLLIGGVLFYLGIGKFTRALSDLSRLTGQFGTDNYDFHYEYGGNDEISDLCTSLNGMTSQIKNNFDLLKKSEERFDLAVQGSHDGIWDYTPSDDSFYASPRCLEILDREDGVARTLKEWTALTTEADKDMMEREVNRLLAGELEDMKLELRVNIPGNATKWILLKGKGIFTPSGRCIRLAGSLSDISRQKEAEDKLIKAAMYDSLTNLPNRAFLAERLKLIVSKKKRYSDKHFALLFLDYDGFKKVNDTYGHTMGDKILKMIAGRLKLCLRPEDLISRIGGDEFILLLEDCGEHDDIARIAQRVLEASAREFEVEGESIYLSVSIGIATDGIPYNSLEELIQYSDIAMYHAKNKGKGTFCFFKEEMQSRIRNQWRIQNDLHKAIKNNELYLVFQPILSLRDFHVKGAEVLMRWNHPIRGPISPVDFIPTAEESHIITQLTGWLLDEIIRINPLSLRNRLYEPLRISFNLSSRDFLSNPSIMKKIRDAIPYGSPLFSCLDAEVTETTLIENFEMVNYQLSQLRAMGMKIKLDDFGTGYSSLSYLHSFPLDELKIDRSFVSSIPTNHAKVSIVRHIINLAHDLNLKVIAEGIENREQLRFLIDAGCDMGQGYFYSPPLKFDEFLIFLEEMKSVTQLPEHSGI